MSGIWLSCFLCRVTQGGKFPDEEQASHYMTRLLRSLGNISLLQNLYVANDSETTQTLCRGRASDLLETSRMNKKTLTTSHQDASVHHPRIDRSLRSMKSRWQRPRIIGSSLNDTKWSTLNKRNHFRPWGLAARICLDPNFPMACQLMRCNIV